MDATLRIPQHRTKQNRGGSYVRKAKNLKTKE